MLQSFLSTHCVSSCVYNITLLQNLLVQNRLNSMAWKTLPSGYLVQELTRLKVAHRTPGQCLHEEGTHLFSFCNQVTAPPAPAQLIWRLEIVITKMALKSQTDRDDVKGTIEQGLSNQPRSWPPVSVPFSLE